MGADEYWFLWLFLSSRGKKDPILGSSFNAQIWWNDWKMQLFHWSGNVFTKACKVVNFREVREVQEGATCFCDKKLSKLG